MARKKERLGAVVVNRDECDQPEQQKTAIRERFWQAIERIRARNADRDPDEILRNVTEVVEEVRQERYEKARSALGGR